MGVRYTTQSSSFDGNVRVGNIVHVYKTSKQSPVKVARDSSDELHRYNKQASIVNAKKIEYVCKENEQCEINKTTRNVCQRCRYLKCIQSGMSTDLVLNESERSAKRLLIRENREKRELENIRQMIKANSLYDQQDQFRATIDPITASYCRYIDVPIQLQQDSHSINIERWGALSSLLVRQVLDFARSMSVYEKLSEPEQQSLIGNESWLEVQLLRFVHQYDPIDSCLLLSGGRLFGSTTKNVDLNDELTKTLTDLLQVAKSFNNLQLDNRQLALISALFIYNPDHLDNKFAPEPKSYFIMEMKDIQEWADSNNKKQ
ncbi:Nuclear hormone receptor-like 1 [Toxocara canis]|uniref:Nuclear hormone receptor-like 1 n=1 Tax=Toxocara canis TaxID=6265 RepID=A0A0B2VRP1_TOXCA|nr:Nuclear hormone receptor-like 1 [Toxocara canis]